MTIGLVLESAGRPLAHTIHVVRRAGTVVGAVLALGGVVWILQGLDIAFAPDSFMTDSRQWVLHGTVAVGAGLALIRWGRK